jgi:hypothetical protein
VSNLVAGVSARTVDLTAPRRWRAASLRSVWHTASRYSAEADAVDRLWLAYLRALIAIASGNETVWIINEEKPAATTKVHMSAPNSVCTK